MVILTAIFDIRVVDRQRVAVEPESTFCFDADPDPESEFGYYTKNRPSKYLAL
jgi:hypothetical protein